MPNKKGKHESEFDGKTLKIENTGDKTYWACVYWNERFACQPGDEIKVSFTASGKGPIYCEAGFMHWHGNWAGRMGETIYLSDQPKQYTTTIVVPQKGKNIKRTPMEFRIMYTVKHKMNLSDVSVKLQKQQK